MFRAPATLFFRGDDLGTPKGCRALQGLMRIRAGAMAVVVGKAIYEKAFTVEQAIRRAQPRILLASRKSAGAGLE